MVQEVYVSFEVAKLLKEKGFPQMLGDVGCVNRIAYYLSNGLIETGDIGYYRQRFYNEASAPTQAMAMAWLREEHDICIYCYPSNLEEYGKWESGACWIKDNVSVIFNNCSHALYANSYEEAVEAALKYALDNLL